MKPIRPIILAICCSSLVTGAAETAQAPVSAAPPSAPPKRSAAELEKLAMPIALHPDPLIAVILPASVYPVEIVLAARFIKDTNNIPKVDQEPWDENVKAVARFPELVNKMSADLEWTVALGQAFLEQRTELMDTIQALRAKAQKAGTLQTTPQQIVTVTNTVVERIVEQQPVVVTNTIVQILPSNPEVIYVPSYPPAVYYPAPVYAYSYGYYPYAAPLLTFGAGMLWGAAIANWNHCDWGHGDVNVDIDRNTNINRDRNTQRPQPRSGDRAANRGQQRWQPDQNRLRSSGAPSAATREARGWNNPSGAGGAGGQRAGLGGAGARPSQQPALGGSRQLTASGQPRASTTQRASTAQRPAARASSSRSSGTYNRSATQRSSAFSGVGSGSSSRSYSNRGSYSRGGSSFSGGRGGGGRGGRR